jgi:hypothetical protein
MVLYFVPLATLLVVMTWGILAERNSSIMSLGYVLAFGLQRRKQCTSGRPKGNGTELSGMSRSVLTPLLDSGDVLAGRDTGDKSFSLSIQE